MNWIPILACGPSVEAFRVIFGLLGMVGISFCCGIFCLCLGSRSLGLCLVGVPVALFGLFYLWSSQG